MRQFIRHPSDIPIEFQLREIDLCDRKRLKNYSEGGLCFISEAWIEPDAEIYVTFPASMPDFHAAAVVVWCKYVANEYEVGIRFLDADAEYALRMIEQIHRIEGYKHRVLTMEGRALSGDEAAMEWIERHAAEFPR